MSGVSKQEIEQFLDKVTDMANLLGLTAMATVVPSSKVENIETGSILKGSLPEKNLQALVASNASMVSTVLKAKLIKDGVIRPKEN